MDRSAARIEYIETVGNLNELLSLLLFAEGQITRLLRMILEVLEDETGWLNDHIKDRGPVQELATPDQRKENRVETFTAHPNPEDARQIIHDNASGPPSNNLALIPECH